MKISLDEFKKREEFINCKKHDNLDLLIWNYTHSCQYAKAWDEYTKIARGLITDNEGNIIARPFEKFFNLNEIEETKIENLSDEIPTITEKLDGSLGILYWKGDQPSIATRGSFNSEQAIWATNWFRHNAKFDEYDRGCTYLFEILAKWNRIVVKYDYEGLTLLAITETDGTKEYDIRDPKGVLSQRSTRDEWDKCCNTLEQKMEDLPNVQERKVEKRLPESQGEKKGILKRVEQRKQDKNTRIPQKGIQKDTNILEQTKGETVYGLQENLSTVRNGFRPQGEEEKVEERSKDTNRTRDTFGNKEMRSCMCKLSQDKNLFNKKIKVCKTLEYKTVEELSLLNIENEEGFVLLYPSTGLRLKIKFSEYVRLHKLITGFSTKSIWECLMNGDSIDDLMKDVPDEFYQWIKEKRAELENQFEKVEKKARIVYESMKDLPDRKSQAFKALESGKDVAGVVFSMLDKRDYARSIWKQLKPKYELPFRKEI